MKNVATLSKSVGFLAILSLLSCSKPSGQFIEWAIIPNQSEKLLLEYKPLHYKYAPKKADTINYSPSQKTIYRNKATQPQLLTFRHNDFSFPLYLDGKTPLYITYNRTNSENPLQIRNYPPNLLETYTDLIQSEKPMQEAIKRERKKFSNGEPNTLLRILDDIQLNRKSVLKGTPYEFMYWASYGEFLVAQIEALSKQQIPLNKRDEIRQTIIKSAQQNGFFSLFSLESQRAGIRDFTNAWAHSFGIADSVRKVEKKQLQIYDVNRIAYKSLNQKREQVLFYVEDDKARAYAEMHLVAERLGEAPYDEAQKSMLRFVQTYADRYPEYTDFIDTFNQEIRSVQPGMKAFPFTYPDKNGKLISLSDFAGKIVYLDFWASWCSPCLEEFPVMKSVYSKIDTSKTVFIGIGLDEDKSIWENSLDRYELPWINVYGGKEFANELFKNYRGGGIPLTVLIGKDGKIERYNDIRASYNLDQVIADLELMY